jgi:hypothetical protein
MAEAYKCDKCKQFNEGKPVGAVTFSLKEDEDVLPPFTMQVCGPCYGDIRWAATTGNIVKR